MSNPVNVFKPCEDFMAQFQGWGFLPREISHVGVPPIKCQGIKTKLIPFIMESICWESGSKGRWIEPFMGSGCVVFNVQPERAVICDTNKHIVGLYRAVQSGELTGEKVRGHLESEGKRLSLLGEDFYYIVRDRFNREGSVLDFLFLNRSCFNGLMRFNRHGAFNVPFGHKPQRFAQAYITKIVNQINWVAKQMRDRDWEFRVQPWQETLALAQSDDFVYMDPPYIGRHADYFNQWTDAEGELFATTAHSLPCGYALSMWLENRYRRNAHVDTAWASDELRICSHFYHVGADEGLRNEMDEALLIKPGFATADKGKRRTRKEAPRPDNQLVLALEKKETYLK